MASEFWLQPKKSQLTRLFYRGSLIVFRTDVKVPDNTPDES